MNTGSRVTRPPAYPPSGARTTPGILRQRTPNALDFGLVGDGVTDDTAALIAYLARSDKNLFFPEGTYLINPSVAQAPITFGNKLAAGAGQNKTIFKTTTQLSALNGAPTTGAFALTKNGQTTAGIAAPLSAASIQSALAALPSVGAGNVAVSALGPANCGTYKVTWQNALGNSAQTLMTLASNTLAGGPTATTVTLTYGVQGDGTHNATEYIRVAGTRLHLLKANGLGRTGHLRDFSINGPFISNGAMFGSENVMGVKMDCVAGLLISDNGGSSDGKNRIERVGIGGFDVGMEWNNNPGHTALIGCVFNGNYFNLGITLTGNDCLVEDCLFDTSSMASIGILSGNTAGLAETMFIRTHLGNGPFGIYDERTGALPFLGDCQFLRLVFEACGNGAIFSAQGAMGDMVILHPGHYFAGSTRRIWWLPKDYAVSVGTIYGLIDYDGGSQPFADGDINTWHTGILNGARVVARSNLPEDMVADDGSTGRFFLLRNQLSYTGTGTITAGNASVVVTPSRVLPANVEGFRGNANSMALHVEPNDPTQKGGFTSPVLIASGLTCTKGGDTTFTVTCTNGAVSSNLTFRWVLRSAAIF